MSYKKIEGSDLLNKGVIGLPDTPGLSKEDMQSKLEEIARAVIIPAFNALIDALVARDGNVYTKDEVEAAIANMVLVTGAADMRTDVYDTDGDGIVDKAKKLASPVKIGSATFDGTAGVSLEAIGAATTAQGALATNITTDIKYIKYVTALPSSPDSSTLYLVKK